MELNDYQRESRKTALYPEVGSNAIYPTLGLVGEAGEVADKVKKILRDKKGVFDKHSKDEIKFELGDVLWYISQLSSELGYELDEIANSNLQQLRDRQSRGKIGGSGDTR
jgi:NTP pyrophosphatase (non-canonical NTP hydrolase)